MIWLLLIIPGIALLTAAVMLALALADLMGDITKPRWRPCRSLDVIGYAIGFTCMIVTSLYVLITALLWL